MKAIEAFFNALFISIAVAIVILATLFIAKGGEVKVYEKPAMSNIVLPLIAMADGKEHRMFTNDTTVIDISYNK
jgi:hypothetical protein